MKSLKNIDKRHEVLEWTQWGTRLNRQIRDVGDDDGLWGDCGRGIESEERD